MSIKNLQIEARVLEEAQYYVDKKTTVRSVAKKTGISKTTVHKDLTERLKNIDLELYQEVRKQMEINTIERPMRGGHALQQKMLRKKQSSCC